MIALSGATDGGLCLKFFSPPDLSIIFRTLHDPKTRKVETFKIAPNGSKRSLHFDDSSERVYAFVPEISIGFGDFLTSYGAY